MALRLLDSPFNHNSQISITKLADTAKCLAQQVSLICYYTYWDVQVLFIEPLWYKIESDFNIK